MICIYIHIYSIYVALIYFYIRSSYIFYMYIEAYHRGIDHRGHFVFLQLFFFKPHRYIWLFFSALSSSFSLIFLSSSSLFLFSLLFSLYVSFLQPHPPPSPFPSSRRTRRACCGCWTCRGAESATRARRRSATPCSRTSTWSGDKHPFRAPRTLTCSFG